MFGEDGTAFRTEDARLAGWVLLEKEWVGREGQTKKGWQRFFIEVDPGELRIFDTEPPMNYDLTEVERLGIQMELSKPGEDAIINVLNGARSLVYCSASSSVVRALADRLMIVKAGADSERTSNMMNTVSLLPKRTPAVLTWNGSTVSTFNKHFKRKFALNKLEIDTSENPDEHAHRLCVRNGQGETLVMTVPEALLLLQWVGAINECDVDPSSTSSGNVLHNAIDNLFQPPSVPQTRTTRSMSLGVRASLGLDNLDPLPQAPSRSQIKADMMDAPTFPLKVPTLKEMLADQTQRLWVYKWSLLQVFTSVGWS